MLLAVMPPERSHQIPKTHTHTEILCLSLMEKMITVLVLLILKSGAMSVGGSVTFENPNTCALKGSSVELGCSYKYPDGETVKRTAWFKGVLKNGTWQRIELSEFPSYQNRSEYVGDLQHNCTLAIHDLQINDTGHYYFRFDTEVYGRRSKTSVHLTVTELSARVNPDRVRAGDKVTLECRTSCQLSNIVWFKDGRPVTKPEFEAKAEDAGNYVCALEGQESVMSDPVSLDVQYPPLNVSVEMSYPDNLTVGTSVNLTCHSAANPAADSYTWYRGTAPSFSSMLNVGSGQVLFIPSVEVSHTGLYLCQARNSLGENNSTEVLLSPLSELVTVGNSDSEHAGNHVIFLVSTALKVFVTVLLTVVMILTCKKKRNKVVDKKESSDDHEYIIMT